MLVMTSGVEKTNDAEKVILCVGIFVGIIWLIVGYLVVNMMRIDGIETSSKNMFCVNVI